MDASVAAVCIFLLEDLMGLLLRLWACFAKPLKNWTFQLNSILIMGFDCLFSSPGTAPVPSSLLLLKDRRLVEVVSFCVL